MENNCIKKLQIITLPDVQLNEYLLIQLFYLAAFPEKSLLWFTKADISCIVTAEKLFSPDGGNSNDCIL